ncbi:MAG: hypothetical protein GX061_06435 [Eubacteriaceae bacterium]|nr:hypothetical protein [Eubacteriaceae bacterium]
MKRKISLLLSLIAVLIAIAGCTPQTTLEKIWEALEGTWVYEAPSGGGYFAVFSMQEGKYYYTSGIMNSGAVAKGEITDFSKSDTGGIIFEVNYPEVPENEENSGSQAFAATYEMDIASLEKGAMTLNDIFLDNASPAEYTYCAATLEMAYEVLESRGNDRRELWEALEGVWVCEKDGGQYFIWFSGSEEGDFYTSGVMFSGAAAGGAVSETRIEGQLAYITVNYSELPANEVSDGAQAQSVTYEIEIGDIKKRAITVNDRYLPSAKEEYLYYGSDLEQANDMVLYAQKPLKADISEYLAPLEGTWRLLSQTVEGYTQTASESGNVSTLTVDKGGTADFYSRTKAGWEMNEGGMKLTLVAGGMYYSCPNGEWYAAAKGNNDAARIFRFTLYDNKIELILNEYPEGVDGAVYSYTYLYER